jgi:hypothetical protein
MEAATAKAATMETATAHAASVETATATATAHATATVATAAATTTTTTASQRYRWRSQANRRNCQQRDHRLTQHHHSPKEYRSQPRHLSAGGNRSRETLLASTSLLLNSARETPD